MVSAAREWSLTQIALRNRLKMRPNATGSQEGKDRATASWSSDWQVTRIAGPEVRNAQAPALKHREARAQRCAE